jgi:hypothetical protein
MRIPALVALAAAAPLTLAAFVLKVEVAPSTPPAAVHSPVDAETVVLARAVAPADGAI